MWNVPDINAINYFSFVDEILTNDDLFATFNKLHNNGKKETINGLYFHLRRSKKPENFFITKEGVRTEKMAEG